MMREFSNPSSKEMAFLTTFLPSWSENHLDTFFTVSSLRGADMEANDMFLPTTLRANPLQSAWTNLYEKTCPLWTSGTKPS